MTETPSAYIDFNPHSREGSDQTVATDTNGNGDFNPHSREGSDAFALLLEKQQGFQSTLPRRE